MKLTVFPYLLLSLGFSVAFFPGEFPHIGLKVFSTTHTTITQAGLWITLIDFLKDNPKYVNNGQERFLASIELSKLVKGQIPHRIFDLVKTSKFEDAVHEVEFSNRMVDIFEKDSKKSHFDSEQFVQGSIRILILKKSVVSLINNAGNNSASNYEMARMQAGRYLHALQDFYSHSNWIEVGNREPLVILGDKIISETFVADRDQATCTPCTPANWTKLRSQTDDCKNNLILSIHKLTSGYAGAKPSNVGKCSHGGLIDNTRVIPPQGGINKDTRVLDFSPHYRLHSSAASVAINATKLFFDSVRQAVGDENFAKFLNMEATRTITFVIDTTDSMAGEIAAVQNATVQFIEDAAENQENFYYVLVPFNDPEFGPAYVTRDPIVAEQNANSLRATGGGDCPDMGMSGLYLAIVNSLPNSDVFFFSDASAKDEHSAFSVMSIALQKKCRIYFFITGSCSSSPNGQNSSGVTLYENMATTTGGQLFEFSKSNLYDAIKLLRHPNASKPYVTSGLRDVFLLAVRVKNLSESSRTDRTYFIRCDSTIFSMTAVLTAHGNVSISAIPPQDNNQTETITIITQTSTVYSVRITRPMAGNWGFNITAAGSYSFQVRGLSSLAFTSSLEAEYVRNVQNSLVPVSGNPVKGKKVFLTVVSSQQDSLQADRNLTVHAIDTAGESLGSFDLNIDQKSYGNLYYGSVVIHFDEFKLMYMGYGQNGEIVQRVLPRVLKPQEFEFKLKISAENNNSFMISPNERTSFNLTLYNYGSRQEFKLIVFDEKSFVVSYSPNSVMLNGNDSVDIQIDFLAPANTNDATITSVSVSASVPSSSNSEEDLANFITFGVSVFSKEFQFVNHTEATTNVNLTTYLIPRVQDKTKDTDSSDDSDDDLPTYAIVLIAIAAAVVFAVIVGSIIALVLCRKSKSRNISGEVNATEKKKSNIV